MVTAAGLMRDADDAMRCAYHFMDHHARRLDPPGLLRALASRTGLMRAWAGFFEEYRLLLMPTSWTEPFAVDQDQRGEEAMRDVLQAQSPLLAVAVLGLPGLSVPTGLRHGRPTGVQLVADRFREDLCLAAAEVIEVDVGAVSAVDPSPT